MHSQKLRLISSYLVPVFLSYPHWVFLQKALLRGGRAVETLQHETLWGLMSFGTSYPRAQGLFKGIVVYLNALPLTDGDDLLG